MKRIFPAHTYGTGPRSDCWWDETCEIAAFPEHHGEIGVDVAIVGAGFTGLSAALEICKAGLSVAVLEAEAVGWGASGRNGGFCCLGGGLVTDGALDRLVGRKERLLYRAAEAAAVDFVKDLLDTHDIDADTHSRGETVLAHRRRDMDTLKQQGARIRENYGVDAVLHCREDLVSAGLQGPFFGGMTIPVGFALNPRKLLAGLVKAAVSAGVQMFETTPVLHHGKRKNGHVLEMPNGKVTASNVILATNGYSPEDLDDGLRGTFMPGQSSVLVTRPLTRAELEAQGWTSDQMCYDTRNLLHYFRLMPDRRFLFGMRGELLGGAAAEIRSRRRLEGHFRRMFPAWNTVEVTHRWSGLVALSRKRLPFAGPTGDDRTLLAALCYHGNGVAMGTYCGKLVTELVLGREPRVYPAAIRLPLRRFPLGTARRLLMPPLYGLLMLKDV
jgi:glycine/D-amino acid oxidase-like deaminating enzyme